MKVLLICNAQQRSAKSTAIYSNDVGPIILKIMKYYAGYGYKDFVLCLGEQEGIIKNYFLNYKDFTPVDFVLTSGSVINLLGTEIDDWNIMFEHSGGMINKSRSVFELNKYLKDDRYFLVNDDWSIPAVPLDEIVSQFNRSDRPGMRIGNSNSFIFRKNIIDDLPQEQPINISTFAWLEGKMQVSGADTLRENVLSYI